MNKCFTALLLVLLPFISNAQSDTSTLTDNHILKEVTVTATRNITQLSAAPFSVEVLSRKKIEERMFRSTPESMMIVPGAFVQKTNHGGGSPYLRGLTGNQILMLVDGVRLNNSTFRYGPNQYLNTIDPFTISRMEIVKGSGSVQYGSDALGGVIHVFTADPCYSNSAKLMGEVNSRYWSGDMEKTIRGGLTYTSKNTALTGGVSYKDFGDLIAGGSTGKQSPSGYKEVDADIKLKLKIAQDFELVAAHQFVEQQNVPVTHKVLLENYLLNEMTPQRRNLSYIKLIKESNNDLIRSISLISSYNQTDEGRNLRKNGSNTLRTEKDQVGTIGLTGDIHSVFTTFWTANSGIEYYKDKINSSRTDIDLSSQSNTNLRGLYPDGSTYANLSVYNLNHLKAGDFTFEAGMRYNWLDASIYDETLGDVTINPGAFVVNGGLSYNMGVHNVFASVSTGFRAPNIDDMGTLGIVDFRYEVPAFDLKPEKNQNTELGYKLQTPKLNATLSFFHNRLNGLITRVKKTGQKIDGYDVYQKENIDKAVIKGGEAALSWLANKNLQLNGFISLTSGENLTANEPLRRISPLNSNLSAKYSIRKFNAIAEWVWADKQDRLAAGDLSDNRIPPGGTPGWNLLNAFFNYQLKSHTIGISAQNILNEDYRTHGSGINNPGRSVLISYQWKFGFL